MRIPVEKELTMKKAILKAIEKRESPAKLADHFGVSKSIIYKYRRALKVQGFIKKNEENIYVIIDNKFSTKRSSSKSENSCLSNQNNSHVSKNSISNKMEAKLQSKIEKMRQTQKEHNETNLLKKIFGRFKK